ncbi:NAD(P)H-dependent oxidoreductase [Nonomuraea glycinis]|uniref:FMN reductase n=1 Tax=Nonomuraea glycinis TaxID=2047744 RepID=A0A918A611_9ACTN|nr:NAD(P)H-dependent oxidoreductase [Nonomuraea glycinis]MCA2175922.1 NAD(P)H-dependent oxidoreductase [Nonomuraea glycinis]GGP05657.1 FMN reductase [Nonomuraea glycinis]
MIKIGIIIGSTRPGRNAETVARWVHDLAVKRDDAAFELVDLREFDLPHLDEALPAAAGRYDHAHTRAWSDRIAAFDGFIFVTPEYNHSTSGALKNAIDFLFAEWADKSAAFVSYGVDGGARAAEHLRQVLGQLKVADVPAQVTLSLHTDFENFSVFQPGPHQEEKVTAMLDQLLSWASALRPLRV